MRRIVCPFLAAASLLLASDLATGASRPRYGGTLRVAMRARLDSLDPADRPSDSAQAAAQEKLASLVFDRLVRWDVAGRPQPSLAISWQHDVQNKKWEFRLRAGVKFHDGTPLTPTDAAEALKALDRRWRVSAADETLVIESDQPLPALLAELARTQSSIVRRAENALIGTGAFRIAEWQPGRRVLLAANEEYWDGRPFLDAVEIQMGRTPREQWIDFELDRADVVEILPDQFRRASQGGRRIWATQPVELMVLVFARGRPATEDPRARQALAMAIDRATIHQILLQRQGELAGALLPQWLSGYAFLFASTAETERARKLWEELGPGRSLLLAYDWSDSLAQAIAERIAVNAREAGITVQVLTAARAAAAVSADVRLVQVRLDSPDAPAALPRLAAALDWPAAVHLADPATPEVLYAAEREIVETSWVIPLFHLPEIYAVSARVKSAAPPRWDRGWSAESIWLDTSAAASTDVQKP